MLIVSRFSHTTRIASHFFRHSKTSLARSKRRARIESTIPLPIVTRDTSPLPISTEKIIKDVLSEIRLFLRLELRLKQIEGFVHRCLDKALLSTPLHQEVYEAVIIYLIRNMWPQPAATVYDRMSSKGFISSDAVDARMLAIVLADAQDSAEAELQRISDVVSNPDFSDQHFVAVLNVAEDYNVRPKFVISLIRNFLRAKEAEYVPRRGIIAAWLRAAVKLGDVDLMRDILGMGSAALRLSAIVEAWEVADKLDDCLEKLGIRLVGAVANAAVTETEFLRSLEVIKDVGMNAEVVARVCASFLANRDENYSPKPETIRASIDGFIQADMIDKAFDLLNRVGIQPGKRPIHRTFLANLRDSRPLDHHSFSKLLSAIDGTGIPLDTSLLNIVISREVRLKHALNALSIYNEMKKNPDLLPDSYTFGSLFSMYRRTRPPHFSGAKSMATPTFPLRELFRELMQNSKRDGNPIQPNTALLNVALKAFISQRDYAGAIIVVGTFSLFQVPLDNRSYYCVVKNLVRRVWSEVIQPRHKSEERWVDRFLGVEHYRDIVLSRFMVQDIFTVLRRKDFDLSLPLYAPKPARRHRLLRQFRQRPGGEDFYTFPTMEMMESLERPDPADFVYDPVPLMRLLSRAVYADAVVHPEESYRKVDELAREAEGSMVPNLAQFNSS